MSARKIGSPQHFGFRAGIDLGWYVNTQHPDHPNVRDHHRAVGDRPTRHPGQLQRHRPPVTDLRSLRPNENALVGNHRDDVDVNLDESQAMAGLETALNEAEVLGLRAAPSDLAGELLLQVCAQPEDGGPDPDPRRILRLLNATRLRVLLREERPDGYGPAIPLTGLDEVESFFASLGGWDAMYGWQYLDRPSRIADWPAEPSLTVELRPGSSPHSLFWFTECWRADRDGRYCIEGTVDFDGIEVTRADGVREPVEQFIAEARRWWDVLYGRNGQSQRPQQRPGNAPSWRTPAPHLPMTMIAD
jgi:hypothetical protein